MHWIEKLYAETHALWLAEGADPNGYAIFFSPVTVRPRLAIIGYNPGGAETLFQKYAAGPPAVHEYTLQNFRLAVQMRKIFGAAGMLPALEESVKFNLVFYRSRRAAQLKNKQLISFSENKTIEIINRIQPHFILAEGFATFNRLMLLMKGKMVQQHFWKNRCFFQYGHIHNMAVIGILHPTGAVGISDEMLAETGRLVKKYMAG